MGDEPRARYADVGEAMRATIAAAGRAEPKLGINDWRVLNAVLFLTASWSRLEDDTTINQVAIVAFGAVDLNDAAVTAGWRRRRASEALSRLRRAGVIVYRAWKGPGARVRVGLAGARPAPYESHPETRYDGIQTVPESHPAPGSHPVSGSHPDIGSDSAESHPAPGSDSNGHVPESHPDLARMTPGSGANGTSISTESHPGIAAHREALPRMGSEESTEGPQSHLDRGSHPDPGTDSPPAHVTAFYARTRRLAAGEPDPEPVEATG